MKDCAQAIALLKLTRRKASRDLSATAQPPSLDYVNRRYFDVGLVLYSRTYRRPLHYVDT